MKLQVYECNLSFVAYFKVQSVYVMLVLYVVYFKP